MGCYPLPVPRRCDAGNIEGNNQAPIPPASREDAAQQLHGFLRESVIMPDGVDLTASVLDDPLEAELGGLHA